MINSYTFIISLTQVTIRAYSVYDKHSRRYIQTLLPCAFTVVNLCRYLNSLKHSIQPLYISYP
nr:MAG TPA: hypothetical protein [Caudoviricetes sp.]